MNLLRSLARPGSGASRSSLPGLTLGSALLGLGISVAPVARAADELPTRFDARSVNERTVGVVFHDEDVYRRLIDDLADLSTASNVRVVPIVGFNEAQTIYDMLYMKGADLGIVHADVFEYMAREHGERLVERRIGALAELSVERIAVIADEAYGTLAELEGRKVNFQAPGEGSDVSGTILFDTVGVEVEPTRFDALEALEKVKSGEIAAMVHLVGAWSEPLASLSPADGVRLLALPRTEPLLEQYRAAELTDAELPGLIDEGGAVPSLEVPVILAAYDWPATRPARFGKARRFVESLVDGLDELKRGSDTAERWKGASLGSDVPGASRSQILETVLEEREALAERQLIERRTRRIASLMTRQEELVEKLGERVADGDIDASELETLIEQLQAVLDE